MSDVVVKIRLFGAFRQYGDVAEIRVRSGSSVAAIKEALGSKLGGSAKLLADDSAIANDKTILPGDYIVEQDMQLSILPPVCGG